MKGRSWRKFKLELKTGQEKKKRWWTAKIDWLYLVPHSTCTPCGLVPHFHKSLGLHLTRGEREREEEKKKHLLQLQENTKHEEYCIMPLSCRHSYEVTHDISIRALTCCIRTQSIKHPTACSKSQHRLQCGAKPIKRVFLREGGEETRSQSATNEGST